MIRAIIATINGDEVTLEQSSDRDLIAKVIRQGGRRVWVDADFGERDWLAQTFKVAPSWLACDYALFRNEPVLLACLQSVALSDDRTHYAALPALIRADDAVLLTVHESDLTTLDDAFRRAAQSAAGWKEHIAPLLYNVIEATISPLLSALDNAGVAYRELNTAILDGISARDFPESMSAVYRWQWLSRELQDVAEPYDLLIDNLSTHALFASDTERALKLEQLAMRVERGWKALARCLSASEGLAELAASGQPTRNDKRLHDLRTLLFVLLPLISATLILPFLANLRDDLRLAVWLTVLIALYIVSFAVIRFAP